MTPDSYLDIRLLGEKATDLALPVIGNQVFHVLHGAFRQSPGQYALALPDCKPGKSSSIGNKLRIFGRRDDLMILLDGIKSHFVIRDYCRLGEVLAVPENFSGRHLRHRRFRIGNRNSERKPEQDLRGRRMQEVNERGLPYFKVFSRSNGHGFSLFIETSEVQPDTSQEVLPDSYGLSPTTRPFGLPELPFSISST